MKDPKPLFVLFGAVALFFVLTQLIPWQALALIAFFGLVLFAFLDTSRSKLRKIELPLSLSISRPTATFKT